MIWLAMALQAAAVPAAGPGSQDVPKRFSILMPQPCASRDDPPQDEKAQAESADIVVCADGKSSQSLPLPEEAGPPPGRGANRELSAAKVLALEGTPCAARQGGCTVGFGPPIMPVIGALAKAAKAAFARKPDKSNRVAIDLSEPTPATP